MKKSYLLAAIMLMTIGFGSCVRDEDLELFKHPINLQGDLKPAYGVPVAEGSVELNDLLNMLSSQYTGYIDPNRNELTIVFDTTGSEHFTGSNSSTAHNAIAKRTPSTKTAFIKVDTVITYELPITLFDDVDADEILDNDNINIDSLLLSLGVTLKAVPPSESVDDFIRTASRANLDSLSIKWTDGDGIEHLFDDDQFQSTSASLSELLDGKAFNFNNVNLAGIINNLPRKVSVTYKMEMEIDNIIFSGSTLDPHGFQAMLDSIKLISFDIDYSLSARFPFHISIKKLPFNFSLDMGDNMAKLNIDSILSTIDSGINANLDSARFALVFNNGLPLNLRIRAILLDEDSIPIMRNGDTVCVAEGEILKSNTVETVAGSGVYRTDTPRSSQIATHLDRDLIDDFNKARYINLKLSLGTNNQMVTIEKDDRLGIKAYMVIHPSIGVDISLTNSGLL